MSGVPRHLVLLEEHLHAAREVGDDLVLPLQHHGKVQGDTLYLYTVRGEGGLRLVVALTRFQERLARNAADAEAGASQRRLLLHAGDVHAELRRADGADVSAGPGA